LVDQLLRIRAAVDFAATIAGRHEQNDRKRPTALTAAA
jgi:hypothetical protein